ncbi:hypothetical protein QYM36_007443 [Artemia franciscana]|uniref:Uncharacterized protein n=1 Tax=Artemia franciscana TaxID=6661 RepID=A0AA88LCU1_ARTSF|nr:hypothetical protein QYM36_007443 [Artemia franciscana]
MANTSWLSMVLAITRVLDHWLVSVLFFASEGIGDGAEECLSKKKARTSFAFVNELTSKAHLYFLSFILKKCRARVINLKENRPRQSNFKTLAFFDPEVTLESRFEVIASLSRCFSYLLGKSESEIHWEPWGSSWKPNSSIGFQWFYRKTFL